MANLGGIANQRKLIERKKCINAQENKLRIFKLQGSISINKALDLLSVVDMNVILYANMSYSLVYAHELDRVFSAVNSVAENLAVRDSQKNPNDLVKLVGNISKSALSSLTPWKSVDEVNNEFVC